MKTTYRAALAAGLLLTVLAGCSRSEPADEVAAENGVTEEAPVATAEPALPPPVETAAPEPAPVPVATPSPEPTVAPDAQMLDDADATGMTARVQRDEAPANATEPE